MFFLLIFDSLYHQLRAAVLGGTQVLTRLLGLSDLHVAGLLGLIRDFLHFLLFDLFLLFLFFFFLPGKQAAEVRVRGSLKIVLLV